MRLAVESIRKPQMMNLDEHLSAVELCLREKAPASSPNATPYPEELAQRLVSAGGKRIRPLLLLATFESLRLKQNHEFKGIKDSELHTLAAVAELVHMATLFHDDVIDDSKERRGMPAAHSLHGNKIAILVGDFVYAEAFSRLMEKAFLFPSQRLAKTIQKLVEGEILQHEIVQKRQFDHKSFIKVAELKTASLFSWCSEVGAWAASATKSTESPHAESEAKIRQAHEFGYHLGLAFQLIDDVIDTLSAETDKNGNYSEEFYKEFLASAPSFMLTLLCLSSPEDLKAWQELPQLDSQTQKKTINELIQHCRKPSLLSSCSESILLSLREADKLCKELGNSEMLCHLVAQLRERASSALQGERLM